MGDIKLDETPKNLFKDGTQSPVIGESQIQKVFANSTVLLTGGTGFLGKLFIEKLLRSCPDIKKIYLLARPKKNKEIAERLQEQFNDVIYERLKKENPDFMQKIGIVEGDCAELNVGISEENRILLAQEVEFIFHGAATVRFDEELKKAVDINVRGSREMLKLARTCSKLKAYVHISTAYSNCIEKEIEEKLYDMPMPAEKLIDLAENMNTETLNNITPALLGEYPNTYAFTKAAAEDIVRIYSKALPVAIYRPAIVVSTARDPIPGWINNIYGPTGVVVGAAIGLIHVLHCNPSAVADLVPGDMVVNGCIAVAWKTARDCPGNYEDGGPIDQAPVVYNYVSSVQRPLMWRMFMKYTEIHGYKMPPISAIWCYVFFLTKSKFLYNIVFFFMHWVPAYIVDGFAILLGKKPMLRKAYSKIEKYSSVISYFAIREWKFNNDNVQMLFKEMCEADKKLFDFDMATLDWYNYYEHYVKGVRLYLLKESMDTIGAGKTKQQRLKLIHYIFTTFLSLTMLRLFLMVFRIY